MKKKCLHPRYIEVNIVKCVDCEEQMMSWKKWNWLIAMIRITFPKDFNKRYESYKKQLASKSPHIKSTK